MSTGNPYLDFPSTPLQASPVIRRISLPVLLSRLSTDERNAVASSNDARVRVFLLMAVDGVSTSSQATIDELTYWSTINLISPQTLETVLAP